jgi:HEAT repeat protein
VRETGDRRASPTLLRAFFEPRIGEERRAEIAVALRALEDVRCAAPLKRAVLDVDLPPDVRSLALEIHSAIPVDAPTRAQAQEWARSPDVVVRAFGVRSLDVPDGDALASAARDPEPLVRYAAVEAMASIVRTRPLVDATRGALVDEDAAIREAACRVALFDEPFDATHELIRALGDESSAVRVAACDALEDYPRVAVMLALAESRGGTESGVAADLAFAGVVRRVRASMDEATPRARRRLERWSAPVKWLLDAAPPDPLADAELDDADDASDEPDYEPVDVEEAPCVLFDSDAPPATQRRMLVFRDWTNSGPAGLEIVRACAASPNWSLRQGAAFAFAGLRAVDDLVALASDREPVVRRAAFEELRKLEASAALAPARETLADPLMRPTAGDDALALVAELARPAESEGAVLAELARPDDRDGTWLGAIHLARQLELTSAAPHLERIAQSDVEASVLPHVSALRALRDFGRPRNGMDLSRLEPLDHLEVQRELGEWGWSGVRFG